VAGHIYHVLNRGTGGATVFHKDGAYTAFLDLLTTARAQPPVQLLGFCLMPHHFHIIMTPTTGAGLSPFMPWWMSSHVRRYHRHYRSHGPVWQGRFTSFPIQHDGHLLTVLRYVLRNFEPELTTLRTCVNRQQPFGTAAWQATIATTLGLNSPLRPRGRPRKSPEK
jgi:putative transposase